MTKIASRLISVAKHRFMAILGVGLQLLRKLIFRISTWLLGGRREFDGFACSAQLKFGSAVFLDRSRTI